MGLFFQARRRLIMVLVSSIAAGDGSEIVLDPSQRRCSDTAAGGERLLWCPILQLPKIVEIIALRILGQSNHRLIVGAELL